MAENEINEQQVTSSIKTENNVPNDCWAEVTDGSNENSVDTPDDVSIIRSKSENGKLAAFPP